VLEENSQDRCMPPINNVNDECARLRSLLDDLKKNERAIAERRWPRRKGTLDENRPDIRKSVEDLRRAAANRTIR
jgi:hypothetical protein